MTSLKSKVANSVKYTSVAMAATSILQVVQLVVLGRILGPAVFGLIALVQIVIQFAQMYLDMGITDAIIQREKISRLDLSSLYWFSLLTGLLMFIVLFLTAPLIAGIFEQQELAPLIRVIGISFFIIPFGLQFQTIATKKLDFSKVTKYEVIGSLGGVIITISAAAFFSAGAWALVYGHIGSSLIRTMPWVILGFRNPETRPDFVFSWHRIRDYVSFGMYRLGTATINFFNTKIDQIIIGIALGPQILGFYSMAMNLIMQPIQKLNPMINRVAFPVFSKIQTDKGRLQKGYLFIINLIMALNAPLFAGLMVLAPYVIPLMLGDEWSSIVPIVQILSVYALFRALGNPSGSLLIAVGKVRWSFYWQLAQFFIVPVVVYFSSLSGNIAMVAMAMALLRIILFFINYLVRIRFVIGDCPGDLLKSIFVPIGHSLVMMGVLQVLIFRLPEMADASLIIINTATGGLIYVILFVLFQKRLISEIRGFFVKKALA